MGFLIDSSVLIAGERQKISLAALYQELAQEPLAISAVSASELLHGVYRARDVHRAARRREYVEFVLATLRVVPFDLGAARHHARLWAELQAGGAMIGANHLIISATAVALNYGVITLNAAEFQRIPDLAVLVPQIE
jgi:predicted nucleic acid-binding protein